MTVPKSQRANESRGRKPSLDTLAVWAGEEESILAGATQVPVVHSVAFGYADVDQWQQVALGRAPGHIYSRNTNPTVEAFERKVMALEGAPAATSFATGMAAISNTMFALLAPGDHVVSIKDSYGGTNKVFTEFLPRVNVRVSLCDTEDYGAIEAAVASGCAMLYLESPTNPTLKITDIARLSAAAHRAGALVVVDNTFATPINQNPLALGADIVVHSATKFLGGHADALGGVICGPTELVQRVYHYREITGATLHPSAAYLLLRGLKTLHLRIRQQNASAQRIAVHSVAASESQRRVLSGVTGSPSSRRGSAANAGVRRRVELHAGGGIRSGAVGAAEASSRASGRESRIGGDRGGTAVDDEPCREHGSRASGARDTGGSGAVFGGDRGYWRPHR